MHRECSLGSGCEEPVSRSEAWRKEEGVLKKGLASLGLCASTAQVLQFRAYSEELQKWNKAASLVSKGDEKRLVTRQFLPSLALLEFIPGEDVRVADVGSGAGLPGIPLKIMRPELVLTLIESRLKKALFLREVVERLSLSLVEILHRRAEEVESRYTVVLTRALGGLRYSLRICLPLVESEGTLILLRGSGAYAELKSAQSWIERFGGELTGVREVVFPLTEKHGTLVFIRKVSRET